ncbi:unnamed protein product, partial [Didymodactylos carnosus]
EYDRKNKFHHKCMREYKKLLKSPKEPLDKIKFEEVLSAFKKFAPKKSLDSANTSAFLLKNLPLEYLNTITILFNKCAENGDLFEKGKIAKGICLSKEGAFPFENRLRSISLLPNLAKWFERIMAARIEAWCVEHGIQTEEQSGLMSHRRLQTRIISLVEELRLTVAACNRPALCLFIDFETAFDKLWYPALFKTLKDLEMPTSLRRWICD